MRIGTVLLILLMSSCQQAEEKIVVHPWHDLEAMNDDGIVNVFIEIPAGSNQKWEIDKKSGELLWEEKNGEKRVINYLAYPANYGFIPQTYSDPENGGDGDALDVILLGEALERGGLHAARIIGVLQMLDNGEQDDKLIAIKSEGQFSNMHDIQELEKHHRGIGNILSTWFSNYKGNDKITIIGFSDALQAKSVMDKAVRAYKAEFEN